MVEDAQILGKLAKRLGSPPPPKRVGCGEGRIGEKSSGGGDETRSHPRLKNKGLWAIGKEGQERNFIGLQRAQETPDPATGLQLSVASYSFLIRAAGKGSVLPAVVYDIRAAHRVAKPKGAARVKAVLPSFRMGAAPVPLTRIRQVRFSPELLSVLHLLDFDVQNHRARPVDKEAILEPGRVSKVASKGPPLI